VSAIAAALATLVLAFLVQVAVWRACRPGAGYTALLAIHLGILAAGIASARVLAGAAGPLGALVPRSPLDLATYGILYGAFALAYAVTYSAVQADSPTMTIVLELERRRGASRDELLGTLTDAALVRPRLDDLVAGGLVVARDGRYVIGPRGSAMARIWIGYRTLLRMEKGG
jgi:hypothetical protein